MRYMVIETFTHGSRPVYERARDRGRMLPEGLRYMESWVEEGLGRCFQLMETDDPALFGAWTAQWADLVEFEIVPVVASADAAAAALE
jgi:precorrin-4 methylase